MKRLTIAISALALSVVLVPTASAHAYSVNPSTGPTNPSPGLHYVSEGE